MDGNSYRAEIPEIVRAQIKDPRKFRDDMPKIADASAWHLYQTVIDPALISGKMTDEEGGRAIVHLRNLALHKSGLINYTSTLALPNEADYADHIAIAARIARNVYKDNNYGREIPADGTGGRTQLSRHIGDLEGTPEIPSQPRSESSRAQGNAGTGEPSNRGEAKGKPPEIKASFSNENLELRGRAQPVRHIGDMGILPEGIGNNTGGRLETSTNQGSGRGNSTPKGKPPEIKGAFGPPPSASRTFGKKFQYTKDELTVLNDQAKALVAKLFGNGVRVEAVEGLPPDVPEHIAAYYDNLHRITVTVHLSP
ncbi:MAG: hypothetical protein HY245_06050 [Rhizobiales bacterium]|nr:hypothetical protein [Hyphomicrobiales bacterium]